MRSRLLRPILRHAAEVAAVAEAGAAVVEVDEAEEAVEVEREHLLRASLLLCAHDHLAMLHPPFH